VPAPSGDLFDFDYEVEPILEVLTGKVLEQGLMEVSYHNLYSSFRASRITRTYYCQQLESCTRNVQLQQQLPEV